VSQLSAARSRLPRSAGRSHRGSRAVLPVPWFPRPRFPRPGARVPPARRASHDRGRDAANRAQRRRHADGTGITEDVATVRHYGERHDPTDPPAWPAQPASTTG